MCKLKLLILDKNRGEGQMSVNRKKRNKQLSTDSRCNTNIFMCFYKLKCDQKNDIENVPLALGMSIA